MLESYALFEAHIAPYGTSGKRIDQATEHLRTTRGYTVNPRTMVKWVTELLDSHEPTENRLDGETGREYGLSDVQVCVSTTVLFDVWLSKPVFL